MILQGWQYDDHGGSRAGFGKLAAVVSQVGWQALELDGWRTQRSRSLSRTTAPVAF